MIILWSSVFLIIGILICITGYIRFNDKLKHIGAVITFITLFVGFITLGGSIPVKKDKERINDYEYIQTPYHVIIDTKHETKIIDQIKYYNKEESIKVYRMKKWNSYNLKTHDYIIVEVE